jgi:hypothetical protein
MEGNVSSTPKWHASVFGDTKVSLAMAVLYNIKLDFDDNWEYEEENVDDDSSDEDQDHHPAQAPPSILGNLFRPRFIEEHFA